MPRIHDHENEITYFARSNYRGHDRKFGIKTDDRRRHMYIIGKTGMGKTTLIENMVLQDIYNGHGVCYIDPHGDTVEKILDYIPSWRINDIVYFNPSDLEYPIGFNVLEAVHESQKHLIVAGMMGVFKKIWEGMWSARMEYILNNTLLALLDTPGTTLLAVNRMYSDPDFRKQIVSNIKDPVVKQFWVMEYASYSEKFAIEAVAAIQNKIGQFLTSGLIRNIIGQVTSSIDIRAMMDERKIMLVNLSKGRIGEDNMRLMGGMLITKIQLAAMERVDMPEQERQDFYLYVDEFQNFATESFASILSEARKYRLSLIVAHQYIAQLTEEVRDAVLGNVGTLVLFRVGAPDGLVLEPEMAPRFLVEDIINLPKFQIYLKLMIDGVASAPFSATTLSPIARVTESEAKVVRVSRERYGRSRDEIEVKIKKWSGMEDDVDIDALMEVARARGTGNPPKKKFAYKCSWCAKEMKIPVKLDRTRPIYCEDCREKVSDLKRTREYDARKDLIYDEELNVVGSVAELGSDGTWAKDREVAVGKVEVADSVEEAARVVQVEKKQEEMPKEVLQEAPKMEAPKAVVREVPRVVVREVPKAVVREVPPISLAQLKPRTQENRATPPANDRTAMPSPRKRRRKRSGVENRNHHERQSSQGSDRGRRGSPSPTRRTQDDGKRSGDRVGQGRVTQRRAPVTATPAADERVGKPLRAGAPVQFDGDA